MKISIKTKTKQQNGLTIIELVMAMSIVAILASVAVPSFSSMSAAQKLSSAAQEIQQDLLYARSESVKQNTNIHLSFNSGTSWCYGFTDSGAACNCSTSGSCQINSQNKIKNSNNYSNITLSTSGSASLNGANFNAARGAVENSGAALNDGAITISSAGNSATVSINALGRSSICSNTLSQFKAC